MQKMLLFDMLYNCYVSTQEACSFIINNYSLNKLIIKDPIKNIYNTIDTYVINNQRNTIA